MTDKSKEYLEDSELDAVTGGGDRNHDKWITLDSVSQSISRPTSSSSADTVPTETLSLNYEEVEWTYKK